MLTSSVFFLICVCGSCTLTFSRSQLIFSLHPPLEYEETSKMPSSCLLTHGCTNPWSISTSPPPLTHSLAPWTLEHLFVSHTSLRRSVPAQNRPGRSSFLLFVRYATATCLDSNAAICDAYENIGDHICESGAAGCCCCASPTMAPTPPPNLALTPVPSPPPTTVPILVPTQFPTAVTAPSSASAGEGMTVVCLSFAGASVQWQRLPKKD